MREPAARRACGVALALVAILLACGAVAADSLAEYDKAARTILCDCGCHPQSVHACACGRAAQMRRDIAGFVEQGMTGEQVIAQYVARQGEQVRIAPTASGFNLVAWLGPLAGLLGATIVLLWIVRRWRRRTDRSASAAAPPPGPALPDEQRYRERLRRELEELG